MIVADTNLLAYLLIPGDRTEAAEAVRALDPAWVAPPLWRSELRNVLLQHLRAGSLEVETARAAWSDAVALLQAGTQEPETHRALQLAIDRKLSAYDAEFVALAESLGVPLVTDDRRVPRACSDVAVSIDDFARARRAGTSAADEPDR